MFKCLNNYCISWSYVCDGKWDCQRGEDELVALMWNNNDNYVVEAQITCAFIWVIYVMDTRIVPL